MDSVFFYQMALHRDGTSAPVEAIWVNTLPLKKALQTQLAVLWQAEPNRLEAGLHVFDGNRWRYTLPYDQLCQGIINGSDVQVFFAQDVDYTQLPSNAKVWRNGLLISGTIIPGGTDAVFTAMIPPASGSVSSVNGELPDTGGNVTINIADIPGLQTALNNAGKVKTVDGQSPDVNGNIVISTVDNNAATGTSLVADSGATTGTAKLRTLIAGTNMNFSADANGNIVMDVAGSGSGSVSSVALALPSIFSVSGSPVTTTGTLTGTLASQNKNTFFSGPASGSADIPTFRVLGAADLPVATTSLVGGVSVGNGLAVTVGGVLSNAGVTSFNSRTGAVTLQTSDITGVGGALLASPAFTGTPTAPTALTSDNSTTIATTAFVKAAVSSYTVPAATSTVLGTVIVPTNSGLNVDVSGNVTLLPPTLSVIGGVRTIVGSGLAIDASGIITNTGVASFNTRTGAVTLQAADVTGVGGALLASPAFTGTPTAPTAATSDSSTTLATTAFVKAVVAAGSVTSFNTRGGAVTLQASDVTGVGGALLASPAFTGTPTAPTATAGTNTTQIATTAFVTAAIAASGVSSFNSRTGAVTLQASDVTGVGGALLASPAFTGTPTAPTATAGTNTTQIATTAFVTAAVAGASVTSFNTRTGAVTLQASDVTGVGGALLASPAFTGTPTAPDFNFTVGGGTQIANYDMVYSMSQGYASVNITGPSITLAQQQYSYPTIILTGSLVNNTTVTVPVQGKWTFINSTTPNGFTLTVSSGSGTTESLPAGETWTLVSNSGGISPDNTVAVTQSTADNSQRLATTAFVHNAVASLGVASFNGRSGVVTLQASDVTGVGGALLASPAFTGTPTAPTASAGTNTIQLATTAFVQSTRLNTTPVALSNANVTLSAAQYGTNVIEFTGALTASVTITVPTSGQWAFYNNTTGAFNVTLSNGTGANYVVPQNESATVMSLGSLGVVNSNIAGFVLTPATQSTLGGVIVPNSGGLSVDASGNLSVNTATGSTAGIVSAGAGITINSSGVISANVQTVAGVSPTAGNVPLAVGNITGAAPLASPALTGTPTAPTATAGTNTTQIATTAFVQAAISAGGVTSFNSRTGAVTLQASDVTGVGGALLASPAFTGTPTAPNATIGNNSTTLATTSYVYTATQGQGSVALSNANVTLTAAQYSNPAIKFTGTLTANVVVTLPAPGNWNIYNNTSGAFTVTLSNGTGATVVVPSTAGNNTVSVLSDATAGIISSTLAGGGVTSFNGRTGAVVPATGDYTVAQVTGAAPTATPSLTGRAQIDTSSFKVNALGSVSGVQSVDSSLYGEFTLTATSSVTFNILNWPSSASYSEVLFIKITNGGVGTVSWQYNGTPITPKYAASTAPAYSASGTDVLAVLVEGGTTPTISVFVIGLTVA